MCCGARVCCLCMSVILVVVAIGLLFGFGVFKNGFHKLKDTVHIDAGYESAAVNVRPFLGDYGAPPRY